MSEETEAERAHKQQQQQQDDVIRRKLCLAIRGGSPLSTIRGILEEALRGLPRENEKDEDKGATETATATATRSHRLRELLMVPPPPPPPLSPAAATAAATTTRGTPSDDTSVGTTPTAATTPLLLHEALRHGATIDVIKYLTDACPESLRVWGRYDEGGDKGCHGLALHLAIDNCTHHHRRRATGAASAATGGTGGPYEGAEYLLQIWPEAAKVRVRERARPAAATSTATTSSRRGRLPLHLFLQAFAALPGLALTLTSEEGEEGVEDDREERERLLRHGDAFLLRLLRANPQALRERGGPHGRLPVSMALENPFPAFSLSLETVRAIVEPYPDAVRLRDDNPEGRLPLHAAVARRHPPSVPPDALAYLLALHPEAVRERTLRGDLPLHLASEAVAGAVAAGPGARAGRDDPATIRTLIERWPESVRERDQHDRLPVHRAVVAGAGLGTLQALIDPWPASLMERDADMCLPIHRAARCSGRTETVRYLVERSPDSALVGDGEGRTALHLAAFAAAIRTRQDGATLDTIDCLIEAGPGSVQVADATAGDLPVHAVLRGAPQPSRTAALDVVSRLLEASPATARVANRTGQLPLHLAASHRRAFLPLVRVVAEVWRGALLQPDNDGRCPLHVAMTHHHTDLVEYLVTQRPESLHEVDQRGNLPLHCALVAAARRAPLPMVRLLVESHPEALQRRGEDFLLPVQLAARSDNNVPLETARFLAEAHPAGLQEVDASGRTALHMMLDRRPAPPLPFVTAMIQLGPAAVQVRDGQGFLPLHVAAHNDAPVDVIYYLVRLRPELL